MRSYAVSTAKNGVGQKEGSEQTPLGKHRIFQKIGGDQPVNTVFIGRQPTGEIYTPELGAANVGRDWILTRILWLEGLEPGINQGGDVDTKSRYIYIHGCPDDASIDKPLSRGCVRMRNQDLIELFDLVEIGCPVDNFHYDEVS